MELKDLIVSKEEFDPRLGTLVCIILITIVCCALLYHVHRLEEKILTKPEICAFHLSECTMDGRYAGK